MSVGRQAVFEDCCTVRIAIRERNEGRRVVTRAKCVVDHESLDTVAITALSRELAVLEGVLPGDSGSLGVAERRTGEPGGLRRLCRCSQGFRMTRPRIRGKLAGMAFRAAAGPNIAFETALELMARAESACVGTRRGPTARRIATITPKAPAKTEMIRRAPARFEQGMVGDAELAMIESTFRRQFQSEASGVQQDPLRL